MAQSRRGSPAISPDREMITRAIAAFLLRGTRTVTLARIDKAIRPELQNRAEHAMKFGLHSPGQSDLRRLLRFLRV